MKKRSLAHLSDESVSDGFHSRVSRDHADTADLLEYLGEYDTRKLWAPKGYPSMFAYCVEGLHMSDDVALVRIRAARACRDFPVLFEAVAEGRLHLSAVLLLKPHLTSKNVDELVAAATHQSKARIERLLAERFPRPDVPTLVQYVSSCSQSLTTYPLAPERVEIGPPLASVRGGDDRQLAPERVDHAQQPSPQWAEACPAAASVPVFPPRAKVTPLAPERYALQVTISQGTHDKLRRARELLSHALPSGNVAEVLDRALDALIHELEKRKSAATKKPRASARVSEDPRHVPAHVKRTVMTRDEGRCTFVSDTGRRCGSRKFVEFDHIDPVAHGGTATVSTIRLRCHAHNQYAAECAFGADFMNEQRRSAAAGRTAAKDRRESGATESRSARPATGAGEVAAPREPAELPSLEATFARALAGETCVRSSPG